MMSSTLRFAPQISGSDTRLPITPLVVVHGGAGRYSDDRVAAAEAGCADAVAAGLAVLEAGGSALDASQAAVRVLEEDPTFNAGVGCVLTRDGTVEVDAAVMDGATLAFGAVAAVPNLRNGIELARAVLDDGEHVLLCAEGAWTFGRERGFAPVTPDELITPLARERLAQAAQRRALVGREVPDDPGTVGACALDRHGNVAAATSTGGMTHKRSGRIGDTPLCGCGTYADNTAGAASATGVGETIVRVTMTRVCVDTMRAATAAQAAWSSVAELQSRVDGEGGIICVDRFGRVGAAHNSARMAYGAGMLRRAGGHAVVTGVELAPGEDLHARLQASARSTS